MPGEERYFSKHKPRKCPSCGKDKVVPIVYGYPSGEAVQKAMEGKIALGGCILLEGSPVWRCLDCEIGVYREEVRG